MSEEQKEGIVVNPLHHQGDQGNAAASSEQTSGGANPANVTKEQVGLPSNWTLTVDVKDGQVVNQQSANSGSPSVPTATPDATSSATSSTSSSQPEGASILGKIEGAIEGALEKAEEVVQEVVQKVEDVIAPQTPAPAPAPIVVGGQVNGNVSTGLTTPAPGTNAIGTRDMTLKVGLSGDVTSALSAAKEESVSLPTVQTGISEVDSIVEGLMKDAGIEAKLLINTIKEYIVKMKPGKPIAQKDGILQQVGFYNALLSAINNLEADFRPTMQAILALLHHHREGAFKETHVFRFVEHIPLSTDHRFGFRKVITLLKTLANPQTRQQLVHQIHFENVTKYGLTERGRVKLAAFFGK